MTIPDIAKAFTMLTQFPKTGETHSLGETDAAPGSAPATIKCNNGKWVGSRTGMQGDDPELCNHPTFTVNRPMITLPNIGQTADKVFNRIIPAPNGDCKIVVYPQQQSFSDYNMTILGSASAIACGLNAGSKLDGTTIGVSSGNDSTSGQNAAFVPAPPEKPFAPLTKDSAVCIGFTKTKDTLCLPAGTYVNQDGGLGFDLNYGISLTVPSSKYSLTMSFATEPGTRGPTRPFSQTYNSNQKAKNRAVGISKNFGAMHVPSIDGSMKVASPSDPPVACLFT